MHSKILTQFKKFALNLLFPIECLGCGREGLWLCQDCLRRLRFGTDKKTDGNEKKYNNLKTPALDKIYIAGDYDDTLLADMIKKFKYHFVSSLGKPLANFLSLYWSGQLALTDLHNHYDHNDVQTSGLTEDPGDNKDIPLIIPIPLSKKRRRWRGFNQAELLAHEFAANFSYPVSDGLKRIKHGRAQASLNETERLNNLFGAFVYRGPSLNGRTIILIDDVATTGATLNEAALALRAKGAKIIYGLVLAKG
ncbi:MAG: ComF family protein [Patescibacteria group bacterium]|jgi:ComF family protein